MNNKNIPLMDKIAYVLTAIMIVIGLVLFHTNLAAYNIYIEEDGIVEWLTVVGLLAASFLCYSRFFRLLKERNWWFLTVTFLMGLMLFFAAGEEISWGQRIFNIESSEFFLQNNAQGETNLHNLVVNDVKINKLVFSTILFIAMGLYLIVLPILYKKVDNVKKFIDYSGVPVPRIDHVIAIAILVAGTELIRDGKRAEILEAGFAFLIFVMFYNPLNKFLFQKKR